MEDIDITGITEVSPKNFRYTPTKAELAIPGFTIFLSDVERCRGRGVALYFKDGLDVTEYEVDSEFEECLWTKVTLDCSNTLLVG